MNLIRENLAKLMEEYFGMSGQFLLDKAMQKLDIKDLSQLSEEAKEDFEDHLIDDIFSTVASIQKRRMIRSQLDEILNIS